MAKQIMTDEILDSFRTPLEVSRYLEEHQDQTLSQEQFDRVCHGFIARINRTIEDGGVYITAREDVKLLRFLNAPHALSILSNEKLNKLYNSTLSSFVARDLDSHLEQTYGEGQAHLSPHYSINIYERNLQGGGLTREEMLNGLNLAINVCEITPETVRDMASFKLEQLNILGAKECAEGDYTILQRVGEREGLTLGGEYQHTIEHGIGTLQELSEEEVDVNALLQMENAATPPAAQGRGNWAERTGIGRGHGGRSF